MIDIFEVRRTLVSIAAAVDDSVVVFVGMRDWREIEIGRWRGVHNTVT